MSISYLPDDAGLIDSAAEHAYWRQRLITLPYVDPELADYAEYAAAFQFGWESWACYCRWSRELPQFAEIEHELAQEWRRGNGAEGLPWQMARGAAGDAWQRMEAMHRVPAARRSEH